MLSLSKKSTFRKYSVNENILLNETSLSFYLLGVYFTDGHIRDQKHHLSFGISSADKKWLKDIRDIMCPQKPIYSNNNNFSLEMSQIDCINWLISWGCTPRKSKTASLTKSIPEEYQKDFLRGVIDGDGCLTQSKYSKKKNDKTYNYTKKVIYICSASEEFINQLQKMIPENILSVKRNYGKAKSTIKGKKIIGKVDIFRLIFNDSNAVKLSEYCYYDNHELSLDRKYDIVKSWRSSTTELPENAFF